MLNDCLAPNLRLVVCGTAAGKTSAAQRTYYAGPGNKFWRTLCVTGLTPRQLRPDEYRLLVQYGIGLTDVVKGQAGMDRAIDFRCAAPGTFAEKILVARPRAICFNGKKAAELYLGRKSPEYGLQPERIGDSLIFVAPSTSGAASGYWDIATWQDVADAVMQEALR